MIAFACPACRRKLSVKENMAGRKGKCSRCGQPVVVPAATADLPTMPPEPGPASRDERTDALTRPPPSDPDATQGLASPDAGHDSALTDFLAPAQADDELGRLGKYRVLKVLGHGGMGVVFEAEDPKLRRRVALKAMLPALAASANAAQRFLREAQAMAAVEHDHIVRIYQVDEDRGVPYLAMELLKGEPLDARLDRDGEFPLAEVLRIGREVAEALAAAHATGLIHRDIKPANIWLESPRGRVKLLDFGLARAASRDPGLTQQGAIVGTPAYMAPEQGRGEAVDARSDLFSLGVVLYRLCTGRQPFNGEDTISMLMAVASHQPRPPIQSNAGLPRELSDLVMRLLEKDAARRPASAGEVVEILQALERKPARQRIPADDSTALAVKEATAAPRRRRLPLILAAVLLLVCLVGVGGYTLVRLLSDQSVRRQEDPTNAGPAAVDDAWVKRVAALSAEKQAEAVARKLEDLNPGFDRNTMTPQIKGGVVTQLRVVTDKVTDISPIRVFDRLRVLDCSGTATQEGAGNGRLADLTPLNGMNLGGLVSLNLNWTQVGNADMACFAGCKNLTELRLQRTKVSDAGLAHFQGCKDLRTLGLGSMDVGDAGLAHFQGCKDLRILDLVSTQVSDAGLANFKDCKNLTYLRLSGMQVSDAGLAHFKGCQNLTYLELSDTQVSDAGLAYFKDCKNLTELWLSGTSVTDMGLAYFKDCKNLTWLALSRTSATDMGLAHFAGCKGLVFVDLSGTQVSDAGLVHFANHENLTVLRLHVTRVSDLGMNHLEGCESLASLDLQKTRVTAKGIAVVEKALPRCKIEWNGGVIEPTAGLAPDRKAAEWVLSIGGRISVNGQGEWIKADAGLPREAFRLTAIDLSGNDQAGDAGLAHLAGCKSLTNLNLDSTKVGNAGLTHFKACKNLKFLWLNFTQVGDVGLAHVKDCKNLTLLGLWGTQVSDEGLAHLKDHKNITELYLNDTHVSDAGLAHLKDYKNLVGFGLGGTRVTDEGLGHFKDCLNLSRLWLYNTKVTDAGLVHFKDCKKLTELRVQKTKVTAAKIEELKKALPKCRIEWDGGVIEPRGE